jgi:ATP-binding protein involved in chromosome partitioning
MDAKRCINMIRKLNLNVLGIVENYTGDIFGEGGGRQLAQDVEAPFLGNLAMSSSYRDTSKPTALLDGSVAEEYSHLATGIRRSLQELGREAS